MKVRKFKFFLYFPVVFFSIAGCVSSSCDHFIPKCEQKRFREFFKRFLFLEGAVYTLYGSKPITEIVLSSETPEKKSALQERALSKLSKTELARLKAESFEYEEDFWFEETWAIWEEMLKTLPLKRYLFIERKIGIPQELQKNRYIYFVNIAETAKILRKHYSLFRDYVGFDFDPLSVVFELKNPDSAFWNAIWLSEIEDKNVCLMGILFGYGFENSYPFSWHFIRNRTPEESAFLDSFLKSAMPTEPVEKIKRFNPPHSFLLPGYASFSEFDAQKEQYQNEYKKIRQIYLNSDIIECTLRRLLE